VRSQVGERRSILLNAQPAKQRQLQSVFHANAPDLAYLSSREFATQRCFRDWLRSSTFWGMRRHTRHRSRSRRIVSMTQPDAYLWARAVCWLSTSTRAARQSRALHVQNTIAAGKKHDQNTMSR
jgi:hypothetical protein